MEESSNNEINLLNTSDIKEDEKEIPRDSIFNPIEKLSITKQRKRHQSLPLKQFKVSSPNELKILSSICDNIFEDEVINDNINLSMIKLKKNINLKNIRNYEDENIKALNISLEKSKSFIESEKDNNIIQKDEIDDDDFPERPRIHKKSFIFNNILKIKSVKCPRLLEEQWKYEKILLDYNIIDFTSKTKYLIFYF